MPIKPTYEELEKRIQELEQAESELKTTEKALRESKEKYKNIIENIEDAYYEVDITGNFTFLNDSTCKILGYSKDELTDLNNRKYMNDENAKKVFKTFNRVYKTGQPYKAFDWELIRRDGSRCYVETSVSLTKDSKGHPIGFQGIARDITERNRAEKALRASEQRFRNIVNASPMGIHLYELKKDDSLVFMGANSASDTLLGVRHEQFIGQTIEEAFPGLVDTEIPERYRDASKNGTMWRTEQVNYNEGIISGAFEVVAFQTEPGKMAALFNEITSRKQTEVALQESEEKFRTLVEESPLGISLIGKDGCYKYINPRFEEMIGYTIDNIPTGTDWFKLAFPEKGYRRDVINTWINDQQAGIGQARPRAYTVTCKNGSLKEIQFRPVTMENLDQFVIYEDITERIRMEQHLQQAQKMEAIGTLAGGIAHDFNNLLMGIQGRASLMMTDIDSSHPHAEHLREIEEYIKSLTDLTKQLLGFAREGKYDVKPADLNDLIKKSSQMFGRTKKEIRISHKYQQDLWAVEVDRSQIEQVLLNLYVNAWQAMPGGGDLYLQTENRKMDESYMRPQFVQPGKYVKISITDTGVGMDQATRLKIFDPFFTTKDMGKGTGLGLASSYGIIKNHGGFINVYSEKGEGTTFNMYLPASERDIVKETERVTELSKGVETVLLVDDEEMIINIGQAMLKELGYQVIVAIGGEQAIEAISKLGKKIDLVILDMIMPGVGGGKTFDHIREIQPKMPVILSSGYSINGQATEIMRRGCNGFIQKPYSLSELSQKAREVLDEQ